MTFQHNPLEAARFEYQNAKKHKREVMNQETWQRQRFWDACAREEAAREIYLHELHRRA